MQPDLREGDIVIFSPPQQVRDGDLCFVRFSDNHTTFKQMFFETDDNGRAAVRLVPIDDRYRSRTVPAESVAGAFPAVYKYSRIERGAP